MDKELRDKILDMTVNIRRRLETDILAQLEGTYGLNRDGKFEAAESMPMLQQNPVLLRERQDFETAIAHETARDKTLPKADALVRFAREISFTYLNRMAALRMMETRGLIHEAIARGLDSAGFRTFQMAFSGVTPSPEAGYRRYLELMFDEAAVELSVLFDRSLPVSVLFPSATALKDILAELNRSDLQAAWSEDETIGWIYQYFTPEEQRDQSHKDSQIPRNSYELAFRNQFYTPNYVVRLLTDNTLGRLWFEMNHSTALVDQCRLLVTQPGELVEKRARKDPTEIRVLDPACGSGHFLLYAFELLAVIYEESGYAPNRIPALILRHNLFGIDIDLRATQMTALALWLRAQKYLQERAVMSEGAEPIRRTNIICAEPMPGEKALFQEFLEGLEPKPTTPLVRRLSESIWSEMEKAGEAGSLLKIELRVDALLQEVRGLYAAPIQAQLPGLARAQQAALPIDAKPTEEFWQEVEADLLRALTDYAARADGSVERRLFAEDGAQGVRLIELLRYQYDAVLMNPPFGDTTPGAKEYLQHAYPATRNNLYAAFIDRALGLVAPGGALGVLHPRTGFFLVSFTGLREQVIAQSATLRVVADLGIGVLDSAKVEVAASVMWKQGTPVIGTWLRSLKTADKPGHVAVAIEKLRRGEPAPLVYYVDQASFGLIPNSPFCYWVSDRLRRMFAELPKLEGNGSEVRVGLQTSEDFRFVRTAWEVPMDCVGWGKRWVPFAKGGEHSPFYDDIHLVVDWENEGASLYASEKAVVRNPRYYGRPGITYPRRATMSFNPRVLPTGCIFADKGPGLFPIEHSPSALLAVMASRPTEFFLSFSLGAADADPGSISKSYEVGMIQNLPYPRIPKGIQAELSDSAMTCVLLRRQADAWEETTRVFQVPMLLRYNDGTLKDRFLQAQNDRHAATTQSLTEAARIDSHVSRLYGLTESDQNALDQDVIANPTAFSVDSSRLTDERLRAAFMTKDALPDLREEVTDGDATRLRRSWLAGNKQQFRNLADLAILFDVHPETLKHRINKLGLCRPEELTEQVQCLLSYILGVILCRWDVRIGRDSRRVPGLPGVFDPLPVCSPGMLVGRYGQAMQPHEAPSGFPSYVQWDGIVPDDDGHPRDLAVLARAALGSLFHDEQGIAVEDEICRLLETRDLRSWFASRFFPFHVRQYSKSNRKAPVYWQLRSERKSYGLWLYYHRLTRDTLYIALRDYVEPKLAHEQESLRQVRRHLDQAGMAGSREERSLAKQLDEQDDLVREIAAFRDEIKAVADAGYDPDLNDGVLINIAPLHRLVPWKEAESYYRELKAGKYPWSTMGQRFKFR